MKNEQLGITGMMVYHAHSGEVLQIIEGPVEETQALYSEISEDPRHTIKTAQVTRSCARTFPGWSMSLMLHSTERCQDLLTDLSSLNFIATADVSTRNRKCVKVVQQGS